MVAAPELLVPRHPAVERGHLKLVGLLDDPLNAACVTQQLCRPTRAVASRIASGFLACASKRTGRLGKDLTRPTLPRGLLLGSFRGRPRDLRRPPAGVRYLGSLPSVMSRATLEAPTILPAASRTGELVTETSILRPSFRTRTVSKWCDTLTPRQELQDVGLFIFTVWRNQHGDRFANDLRRRISEMRHAPSFQLVITPSSVLPMIASSRDPRSRQQAKPQIVVFARSVTSRIALDTISPSSVSSGLRLISTGNSLPSLRKPKSSRPDPIDRAFGSAK